MASCLLCTKLLGYWRSGMQQRAVADPINLICHEHQQRLCFQHVSSHWQICEIQHQKKSTHITVDYLGDVVCLPSTCAFSSPVLQLVYPIPVCSSSEAVREPVSKIPDCRTCHEVWPRTSRRPADKIDFSAKEKSNSDLLIPVTLCCQRNKAANLLNSI